MTWHVSSSSREEENVMSLPHQNRHNRRAVLKGAAGLSLAAGLTGSAPGPTRAAQDAANLQFWDMVWGPPEYIDTNEALIGQFNEANPAIQVEYRSTPWANWYQTFTTAIGAGSAPDVSTGAAYQAVQFYDQGAVAAVDELVAELESSGALDDFLPGTIDRLRYDDHYVAVPWAIDIRVLYYRRDLLEEAGVEPPATWEDFAAAASALTTGEQQYGYVLSGAENGGVHHILSFCLNNGGGLFTPERTVNLMDERNVEALQMLSDMVAAGAVHPASAGYTGDDALKAFSQGDAAMILDTPGLEGELPEIAEQIGSTTSCSTSRANPKTRRWSSLPGGWTICCRSGPRGTSPRSRCANRSPTTSISPTRRTSGSSSRTGCRSARARGPRPMASSRC
ncbi:MAG: extracellular solute-binding protein family 1 [Thermomicrobiales bacterium]|nr:extracellular solute-binding protein family 1 [Thermomicrobiales bacterium]